MFALPRSLGAGSGSVSVADGEESMPASFNQEILPSCGYVSGRGPRELAASLGKQGHVVAARKRSVVTKGGGFRGAGASPCALMLSDGWGSTLRRVSRLVGALGRVVTASNRCCFTHAQASESIDVSIKTTLLRCGV